MVIVETTIVVTVDTVVVGGRPVVVFVLMFFCCCVAFCSDLINIRHTAEQNKKKAIYLIQIEKGGVNEHRCILFLYFLF